MIFTLHSAKFGLNLTILMIYDSVKEGQWFIKRIVSSYPKPLPQALHLHPQSDQLLKFPQPLLLDTPTNTF